MKSNDAGNNLEDAIQTRIIVLGKLGSHGWEVVDGLVVRP